MVGSRVCRRHGIERLVSSSSSNHSIEKKNIAFLKSRNFYLETLIFQENTDFHEKSYFLHDLLVQ